MRTNWMRVILGGLLAGLIVNICEFLVNGLVLGAQWEAAMKALNRSSVVGIGPTVVLWLWGFLIGVYALWLYANLRFRFGPGPRTAVITGIAVWIPASLLGMMIPAALHLYRYRLIAIGVALEFVEIILGTVAGAWLYKEQAEATPARAAAAGA